MYSSSLNASTRIWSLEKYQRLNDIRCTPTIIEKRGTNELVIQVNMNLKMLSIVHNGMKLEEFCFSPLVYSHEVICKDVRVLFNTKSQRDGSSNGKFRVRFRSLDYCQSFCSFLSSFLNIIMYEDLQRRDSQNQMNFSMSTSETMNNSYTMNNSFSQTQTDTMPSTMSSNGAVYGSITPQHVMGGSAGISAMPSQMSTSGLNSMNYTGFGGFSSMPSSTPVTPSQAMSRPTTPTPMASNLNTSGGGTSETANLNVEGTTQVQAPIVNVNVSNLISDKAMGDFTSMMESFFERLFSLLESKCVTPQYGWYPIVPQGASKHARKRPIGIAHNAAFTLPEHLRSFPINTISSQPQAKKLDTSSMKNDTKQATKSKSTTAAKSKCTTAAKSLNASRSEIEDMSMRDDSFDLAPATKARRTTSYSLRGAPPRIEQSLPPSERSGDYLDDQIFWD